MLLTAHELSCSLGHNHFVKLISNTSLTHCSLSLLLTFTLNHQNAILEKNWNYLIANDLVEERMMMCFAPKLQNILIFTFINTN